MAAKNGQKHRQIIFFILGAMAVILATSLYRDVLVENRLRDRAATAELVARIRAARDDDKRSALIRTLLRYEGNGDRQVATDVLTGKMYLAYAARDNEVKEALLREVIAGFNRERDLDGIRGSNAAWASNTLALLAESSAEKRAIYQQAVSSFRGTKNAQTRYEASQSLSKLYDHAPDRAGRKAALDALLAEYGDDSDDAVQAVVARTMFRAASPASEWEEKLEIFNNIIARYGESKGTKVQEVVVEAKLARTRFLPGQEGRDALRDLVVEYHDHASDAIRKQVRAAAESLVRELCKVEDWEELDAVLGVLRGGRSRNAVPAIVLAMAGSKLTSPHDRKRLLRDILEEFGEDREPPIIRAVAEATATLIQDTENTEEKIALIHRLFAMHEDNPEAGWRLGTETVFAAVASVEDAGEKLRLLDDAANLVGRMEGVIADRFLYKILEESATRRGTPLHDEIDRYFALLPSGDQSKILAKRAQVELHACSAPPAREKRVRLYDAFIATWSSVKNHEIERCVGNAFMNRALQLRGASARVEAYDEIVERYRGHAFLADLVIQALSERAALQQDDDARCAGYALVVDEWRKAPSAKELSTVVQAARHVASLKRDAEPVLALFEEVAADPQGAGTIWELQRLTEDLVLPDAKKHVDRLLDASWRNTIPGRHLVWASLLRSRLEPSRRERRNILGSLIERALGCGYYNREVEQVFTTYYRLGCTDEEKQATLDAYLSWAENSRSPERIANAIFFKALNTESAAEKRTLYDGIIDRYGRTGDVDEACAVIKAMVGKAETMEHGERDGMYREALQFLVDMVDTLPVEESGSPVSRAVTPILQGLKRSFGDGAIEALFQEGSWSDRFTAPKAKEQFLWEVVNAARKISSERAGMIFDLVHLLPLKAAFSAAPEERTALYGEVIELCDQWYYRPPRELYQALVGKAMDTDNAEERAALLNRAITEKPAHTNWDYPALRARALLGLAREEEDPIKQEALYRQALDGLVREGDLLMDVTRDIRNRNSMMVDRAAQPDRNDGASDPGRRDEEFFAAMAGAADETEKAAVVGAFAKRVTANPEPPPSLRAMDAILDFASGTEEGGKELLDDVLAACGGTTDTLFAMRMDDLRARRIAMETDGGARLALLLDRVETLAAVEETDRLLHLLIRRADAMEEQDRAAVCRALAAPNNWVEIPLAITDNRELLRAMLRWADGAEGRDAALDIGEALEDMYGMSRDPWNAAAMASLRHESTGRR